MAKQTDVARNKKNYVVTMSIPFGMENAQKVPEITAKANRCARVIGIKTTVSNTDTKKILSQNGVKRIVKDGTSYYYS